MSGTITVLLAGRNVEFRPPTDAQFMVVHRILDRVKQRMDDSGSDTLTGTDLGQVAKIMDVLDSMVVAPADRNFLEQKILDRTVDFAELFNAFQTAAEQAGDEADKKPVAKKAPAKKATRGRARRAG